jgi:mRNA (guanine-N7-)-methyltransferase
MVEREKSSIINLRNFHNWIKKTIIYEAVDLLRKKGFNEINILDLATGKGGDLHKWMSAGVNSVYGVDVNHESIYGKNGAIERYNEMKRKRKMPLVKFTQIDLLDMNALEQIKEFVNDKKFELITCNFAIHYFFVSEESLNNFFDIVEYFLKSGGFFIGTALDGDKINQLFSNGNIIQKNLLYLEMKYNIEDTYSPYGNKYIMRIGNEGEDHYFKDNASIEYLVSINELKRQGEKRNLIYVYSIKFNQWYNKYIKNLNNNKMNQDEIFISFLNFTFFYEKSNKNT